MDKKLLVSIIALVFLTGIAETHALNYYNTEFFRQDSATPYDIVGYSFLYGGSCTATVESRATLTGTNYDFASIYYSPDNTSIAIASRSNIPSAITCDSLAPYSITTDLNDYFEGKFTGSTTGSGQMTLTNSYSCSMSGDWIDMIYRRSDGDSFGNNPYIYWGRQCLPVTTLSTASVAETSNNYCTGNTALSPHPNSTNSYSCSNNENRMLMAFPVNGSGGILKYHFDFTSDYAISCSQFNSNSATLVLSLVDYETGSSSTLSTNSVTCTWPAGGTLSVNITGETPVDEDKMYMLVMMWFHDDGGIISSSTFRLPVFANISVYTYHADWNCTAWSECINGSHYRSCTDLNNKALPMTEYGSCFDFPEQSIFIGFDSGSSQNTFYCNEGLYNIFTSLCARDPVVKTRSVPSGWQRNGYYATDNASAGGTGLSGWIEDYVDIDTIDSYVGDASPLEGALKIWFIPRKLFLPVYNTSTGRVMCQATTEGQVGGVWSYVNSTFWISHNVTALSPYMTFSYRAKKCTATMPQTLSYIGCTLGCEIAGNCANSGLCGNNTFGAGLGDDYYTGTGCPQTPPPSYLYVSIRDLSVNGTPYIQNYQKAITAVNWNTGIQEDAIDNMNISHVYELSFSAYPQSGITQQDANCILVDDVNINFRSEPVVCVSSCWSNPDYDGDGINDYTYIEATPLSSGSCQIRAIALDFRCTPSAITVNIEDLKDGTRTYVCDGTTMITWNNQTETPSYTENSPTCIAESGQIDSTVPQSGEAIVEGFANFFTIPAVIGLFMAILLSALISGKINQYTQGSIGQQGTGAIFLVSFIGILTALTIAGFFPPWLYIVLIVIAGGITARVVGLIGGG
jgi:hypothetical protein